jgi:hypothetical protein
MAERVDKRWQEQGLAKYSNAAILGTLQHYGVTIDEETFKKAAGERYPLAIASEWLQAWKGTGQFSQFPYPAAQELWRRVNEGKLAPGTVAEALVGLLAALNAMLEDAAGAPVGKRFAALKELKAKIPLKDGGAVQEFADEVFAHLPEPMLELFDNVGERLATAGHVDDADEFTEWEEFLLPVRRGIASALVQAAKGEKDAAVNALVAISQDASRGDEGQLLAVDALLHLEQFEKARAPAEALFARGEKSEDHHLALGAGGRLAHLLEQMKDHAALKALEPRLQKVADAHDVAHPHHRH